MGKKSGRKRRYKYSKVEFKEIICSKCRICPEDAEPSFCFGDAYRINPKDFIHRIYSSLIEIRSWLDKMERAENQDPDDYVPFMFKSAFCASNFCGERPVEGAVCSHFSGCYKGFEIQINGDGKIETKSSRKKKIKERKKNKKKKERKVYQPYPTFFCRESMREEVHAIVNGIDNKQQNQSEGPAAST